MAEPGAPEAASPNHGKGNGSNALPSITVPPTRLSGFSDPLPAASGRTDAESTWMQGYPYLGFEEVVGSRPVRCHHAEHLKGEQHLTQTPTAEGGAVGSGRRVYCIKSEQAFTLEPEVLLMAVRSLMSYGRHHPRLLRCYYTAVGRGAYDHRRTDLTFVLDDCRLGNLSQKVVRYKRRRELLDERVVWVYCIMILEALHFVHAQKRPHQEVRPWTVWLMDGGEVKLAPPSTPELLDAYDDHTYGPDLLYFSPDLFVSERERESNDIQPNEEDDRLKQRQARDVWALGCVLHELCALRPAFKANTPREVRKCVCSGVRTSSIPSEAYSPELLSLIDACLTLTHTARPTVSELLAREAVSSHRASLVKPEHQLVPHHFATPQLLTLAPLAAVRERDVPFPSLAPGARLEQSHLPVGYYGPMSTAGDDVTALLTQPHSVGEGGSTPGSPSAAPPSGLRRMSTRTSFTLPSLRWPSQAATPSSPSGGNGNGNGNGNAVISPRSAGSMVSPRSAGSFISPQSIAGRLSGILTPPLLSPTSHQQARHHNDDDNREQRGEGGALPALFGSNREQADSVTRSKNRFGSYGPSSPSSHDPPPKPPPGLSPLMESCNRASDASDYADSGSGHGQSINKGRALPLLSPTNQRG